MRIQYTEKSQQPENIHRIKDDPSIHLKAGYQIDGYTKETISTCKRIALALLCLFVVPLLIKDLRRQIFQGKEIVYYCSELPKNVEKVDDLAKNLKPIANTLPIHKSTPPNLPEQLEEPTVVPKLINTVLEDEPKEIKEETPNKVEIKLEEVNKPEEEQIRKRDFEIAFKAKSKEEIREEAKNNPFGYELESFCPFYINRNETNHFIDLLKDLPTDKASYLLLGLLENPVFEDKEKKAKFFVFCLRLIHENFSEGNDLMPEKKFDLFAAVLFDIYKKNQIETFWNDWALDYKDGMKNNIPGPCLSSFYDFFDACILVGLKKNKMDILKIVLDEGVIFGITRLTKEKNLTLAQKLTEEEKAKLIDIAKKANFLYENKVFNI